MSYNPGQNIWKKLEKSSKLDRKRKVWYLLLRVVCLLLPKFNFWKGDWALGYIWARIQKNREKHLLRSATFSKLAG